MTPVTVEMIGLGIENTITREQLRMITGQPDRVNREQIQRLRESGVVICSSCSMEGYFRPRQDRPEEIEIAKKCYAELKRKALSMMAQLPALESYLKTCETISKTDQLELFA